MERAGERLKRVRERLKLTYRDVEEASQGIAERLGNPEFSIALSRLADIENKGTAPSLFRLYSLCAIYRLEMDDVLGWYGAPMDRLAAEALRSPLAETHPVGFRPRGSFAVPKPADFELDLNKTTFLSHALRGWGSLPLNAIHGLDLRSYRYGLIGMEDRSMYPILHPGSLVLLDDRARISHGGWTGEYDRPIYFLEHRDGYLCGWCDVTGDQLAVLPHPASRQKSRIFRFPAEIDLVGQVAGVAMLLETGRRRAHRTASTPATSPNP
jgi:transcriptional regulator with XRE-family HTH domain